MSESPGGIAKTWEWHDSDVYSNKITPPAVSWRKDENAKARDKGYNSKMSSAFQDSILGDIKLL